MIQTIIMTEIFKVLTLLLLKVVLTKAGFLGNRFDGGNKRLKNTLNALFNDAPPATHTPASQVDRNDETTSALIAGLIQLVCTALGCLIVKHMMNSIVQSVKSIATDSSLPSVSSNITQYMAPNTTLNSYEVQIAESAVILPGDITFQFEAIGGLDFVKNSLEDLAEDFMESRRQEGALLQPVAGVLLHGPPGKCSSMCFDC